MENVEIKIKYKNYGNVEHDSLKLLFKHGYNGIEDSIMKIVENPTFEDTLYINVSIKNMPGIHEIKAMVDPDDYFKELYENDNVAEFDFIVSSSAIRPLIQYRSLSGRLDNFKVLNSILRSNQNTIIFEYSKSNSFEILKIRKFFLTLFQQKLIFSELDNNSRLLGSE